MTKTHKAVLSTLAVLCLLFMRLLPYHPPHNRPRLQDQRPHLETCR